MISKGLIRNDLLLLLASVIWGFAFVAQRVGMQHTGPFTFKAIRFAIGVWIILHETMTLRAMAGCVLMICGMLYARLKK